MSGSRRDRILAGTLLSFILAVPLHASAAAEGDAAGASDAVTAKDPTAVNEESAPADPIALLDPADRPVAEKIRDLLAGRADGIFASKKERSAVEAFYQSRNLAPVWLDKGVENARAQAVIARLKEAALDGLDPRDYRIPSFSELAPEDLAGADVRLTQTVLTFARHLQAGRFPYARVSANIQLPQAAPDPADVLARIVGAADPGKALDEFSPPHEAYQKLRAKLVELRGKPAGEEREIPDGLVLKVNPKNPMQDPRVPMLRARFGLSGDPADLAYDAKLSAAVRQFQQANDLPATGSVDSRTVKALNGPVSNRQIDLIIANMERWRWYPRDLGATHVIVNQPDFTLKVVHNGAQVWTTKVVIGDPAGHKQTPLLSETMKSITVNPTWHVPPSIVYGEYLPVLQRDPTALARAGLIVAYDRSGSIQISQPPGGANVLGKFRFNFPNQFSVYQHDTNEKFMFGHDVRAYSHGCMRVQDPAKYAEVLLNIARPNEHWTAGRLQQISGGDHDIQIQPSDIWVHLTYQSVFVDDDGRLQTRRDVYGLDSRMLAAIRSVRAMIETVPADVKAEKPEPVAATSSPSRRKTAATPPTRPVSFFENLFGVRSLQPPRGIVR
jgi:murein L,D-transpeptidase YcbB/YkuD